MLWVKSFHIIAVICWFAALFYLPRLFVYHAMSDDDISRERFKVMERKLYRGIATPSMIATLVLGVWLTSYNWDFYRQANWFWAKVAMVAALAVYHLLCARFLRLFKDDRNPHSHVYYRWFNEVPVLMLVGIIIMVEVQPF